jgi:predicted neuraminidase/peptidoglycan/xylan/chitin deacetylase (PgdA/CDA1 family)
MMPSNLRTAMVFAPGRWGQVHASTLVRLQDGTFLAAWFGGTKEGHNDVAIWGTRGGADGWKEPVCWAKVCDLPHWNPVLHQGPDGEVTLFFKVGADCAGWTTWARRSGDGGASWSPAEVLVPGDCDGRGPAKNKPILLADGTLLAPGSRETDGLWRVFVDRSRDGGRTWSDSDEVRMDRSELTGRGAIQPTLWESAPGRVHMLVRTSCGWICRSDSDDGGLTWCPLYRTSLPNNNSGIDLARAPDGTLLLAYNPVGGDWAARTPLSLAASTDNGTTWERQLDLETEPGEFSYPAVVATPDGFAGTYTWKRESIVFTNADTIGDLQPMRRSTTSPRTSAALSAALLAIASGAACGQNAEPEIGATRIERWPDGKKAAFLMMFDDACPSHVGNVVPELARRGLSGTFYPIPNKGEYKARLAFWEQEAPALPGIVYGNHSYSHKAFESAEHAEQEMLRANEVILRLFPGKTPRLISYASAGGVKHAITGEQIKELAAKHDLIVRPPFQSHGAAVHYKTGESILKDIDKAMGVGGMAYVIFHGVGGDWISFPLDQFHVLLDGLEERRESVWTADPISVHKYETERDTAKATLTKSDAAQLQLELTCSADAARYDQPLTLVTEVPKTWTTCRITQVGRSVTVPAVAGAVRYAARPDAGTITLDQVPGA